MSRAQYPSQGGPSGKGVGTTTSGRMARRARLPKLLVVGVGLVSAVLLAGCSAGQLSQTAEQKSAVDGAQADLGPIAIRDAQLAPPKNRQHYYAYGDDALLQLSIVNRAAKDDKLVKVSSPIAKGVRIEGHRDLPGGTVLRSGDVGQHLAGVADSATTAEGPGSSQRESAPPSGTSTSEQTKSGPLPVGHVNITLLGLKVDHLYSGHTVPVRFTFAGVGRVTVNLPIATPSAPGETGTEGVRG